MSYVSTWYELFCPQCDSSNFIDGGDQSDASGYDPSGCKCWKCGNCFVVDDEWQQDEEIDESSCDDGKHLIDAKLFLEAIEIAHLYVPSQTIFKKKVKELKRKAGLLEEGKK